MARLILSAILSLQLAGCTPVVSTKDDIDVHDITIDHLEINLLCTNSLSSLTDSMSAIKERELQID